MEPSDKGKPMAANESLEAATVKLGLGQYQRHVFLCVGPTCCPDEIGLAAWESLKSELKYAGVGSACQRTKAGCLRVCCKGPTLVVYPEGTWYSGMTAERIPRFVREHIVGGKPIDEWIFARNPLPQPSV
jgi:(2Fe-2S) ferredoxin